MKHIFGKKSIQTTQTLKNRTKKNIKMSLQIISTTPEPYIYPPKNYKISKKTGKLVRKKIKILRPLRIMTTTGLDTYYDGYFGILPSGVFQYIFQIATEMIEHEWKKRMSWSRVYSGELFSGMPATHFIQGKLKDRPRVEVGDIISQRVGIGSDWWRVDKKSATGKTLTLRRLAITHEKKRHDDYETGEWGQKAPHRSDYGQLTGEYTDKEATEEDIEKGRGFGLSEEYTRKYIKEKNERKIIISRNSSWFSTASARVFKNQGELKDLKGKWVETKYYLNRRRPLEKGFNC